MSDAIQIGPAGDYETAALVGLLEGRQLEIHCPPLPDADYIAVGAVQDGWLFLSGEWWGVVAEVLGDVAEGVAVARVGKDGGISFGGSSGAIIGLASLSMPPRVGDLQMCMLKGWQ